MAESKKVRLPNSEWHLATDGGVWRLFPPGNVAHYLLGTWSKAQAMKIAALIESAYEHGATDVRDEIKQALRIGEP